MEPVTLMKKDLLFSHNYFAEPFEFSLCIIGKNNESKRTIISYKIGQTSYTKLVNKILQDLLTGSTFLNNTPYIHPCILYMVLRTVSGLNWVSLDEF